MERVYLDYAATSFVKDEVFLSMQPYFKENPGNASGIYESGRKAASALEGSRRKIAGLLGASNPKEIYFTSGGAESNNWAIKSAMHATGRKHLITTTAEHHTVLESCKSLEAQGYEVTYLPVDSNGLVSAGQVKDAIRDDTALVSIMAANNEVGTVNPVYEIAEVTKAAGVLYHTDAVAAAGHIRLDVGRGIDMLSLSAHKFYGPKGIGCLYVRDGIKLPSFLHGGKQERGRRAGTENIPGIVGMAEALQLADSGMEQENLRLENLRNMLQSGIKRKLPGAVINADTETRLCNYLNILIPGMEARAMLIALDQLGVECSAGSACTTGSIHPSHVLLAMGLTEQEAACALRFTLGATTTEEQIFYTLESLEKICTGCKKSS